MSRVVADHLLERLREWGVTRIYGYPGDGINGILGALNRAGDRPMLVQARHEEMAAFMASAHGKWTGQVGVCMATSGPGAIHLLNGLYDARLDHSPVVAIVGQTNRTAMGGHYQQEVDLHTLYKDVAGEFVEVLNTPEQLPNLVDRAMRIAATQRTVTAIIVPSDVQELPAVEDGQPPHAFKMVPGTVGVTWPRVLPQEADLKRAADVLNSGKKVAVLTGQGARGAADELTAVVDRLGAGVAKALLGKDVLPDEQPGVTGSIGLLGTKPSWDLMMDCDTLLIVGSNIPYAQFLPPFGQARCVQIDIDPRMIAMRYPTEVPLVGDAKETLAALLPLLKDHSGGSWRKGVEKNMEEWWKLMEARAMDSAKPMNPQRVFWELSPRLPENAVLSSDAGSAANWYARDVKIRKGMRGSLSGGLATMGPAVPYAIAAKFCFPDRVAIALTGDGAMQMNGMAEMITAAKYYRQWADPRLVVLVLHNDDLNQVTWEMRGMEGDPKFEASQSIPDISYADIAESFGLRGITVSDEDMIGAAWETALSADRPVVIDAHVSPDVPPIPPHIQFDQAVNFMEAFLKNDPEKLRFAVQGAKKELLDWLPGRG